MGGELGDGPSLGSTPQRSELNSSALNWSQLWHHGALPGDHHLPATSTSTSALLTRPSEHPHSKQGRLRAGVGGYINLSRPICWLLLALHCLQWVRQHKTRALLPRKGYREPGCVGTAPGTVQGSTREHQSPDKRRVEALGSSPTGCVCTHTPPARVTPQQCCPCQRAHGVVWGHRAARPQATEIGHLASDHGDFFP